MFNVFGSKPQQPQPQKQQPMQEQQPQQPKPDLGSTLNRVYF